MAAGYNSLSVTKTGSGISYSFNATAVSSNFDQVRVVCGSFSAQASPLGTTASAQVTGTVPYTDPEYQAGSKTFTVQQYVKPAGPEYEWQLDPYETNTITVTVTWDTGGLRIVDNGTVTICSDIRVKDGNDIKTVVAAYSVEDGVVKPWV